MNWPCDDLEQPADTHPEYPDPQDDDDAEADDDDLDGYPEDNEDWLLRNL